MVHLDLTKNLDKMASLWFVLDFNASFRLVIVDFGYYWKCYTKMYSGWLEPDFDGTLGLVEVNFGGSEKLRSNGLSLVHNGILTINSDS